MAFLNAREFGAVSSLSIAVHFVLRLFFLFSKRALRYAGECDLVSCGHLFVLLGISPPSARPYKRFQFRANFRFSSRLTTVGTPHSPIFLYCLLLLRSVALNRTMTNTNTTAAAANDKPSYNIFRHSVLRYLGYANEVGESFRYQFPLLVVPSYAVSFGYVLADSAGTCYTVWQNEQDSNETRRWQHTVYAGADTLLWQSLASVAIPGAIINLIVKASRTAVRRSPIAMAAPVVAKWLPTVIGLGSIPLIVQPIDHSVDYALDHSTRQLWKEQANE